MDRWISSWGYLTTDFGLFPSKIKKETQRILVYNNICGTKIRIRFSNEYGRRPLCLSRVLIAEASDNGRVDISTSVPVTLDGRTKVLLSPGQIRYSDDIHFPACPKQWIAISTYIEDEVFITGSAMCLERLVTRVTNSYEGDFCEKDVFLQKPQEAYLDFFNYKNDFQCFYGVNRLEVCTEDDARSIVAFGDSITHHGHWSQALALRLYEQYPGKVALTNCGICGNRILHDASIRSIFAGNFGIRAIDRCERDIFDNGNRRTDLILFMMGINDIIHPALGSAPVYEYVNINQIIKGMQRFAKISHRWNSKVMISTLLPFKNYDGKWSKRENLVRLAVNEWIRSNTVFDAFFDSDSAVRSTDDPDQMMAEYDCGDNLHPNSAGGAYIANHIDIEKIISFLF